MVMIVYKMTMKAATYVATLACRRDADHRHVRPAILVAASFGRKPVRPDEGRVQLLNIRDLVGEVARDASGGDSISARAADTTLRFV